MASIPSVNQTNCSTKEEEEEACLHAMQHVTSRLVSIVVATAIELDLFGIIHKAGPAAMLSPNEIAPQVSIRDKVVPEKLDVMLRLLATQALLTCSSRNLEDGSKERIYGLATAAKYLLEDENEGSLAPMILLSNERRNLEVWSHMKRAITEGDNLFNKVHGMNSFQHMSVDPTAQKLFDASMAGISTISMKKILEIFNGFENLASMVDVGGGNGRILKMIISKYPYIKGINFDLPHVVRKAPSYKDIEHVGGDMFAKIPMGDAIMLKDILHNWSDEDCLKILKNCYDALPNNGKVIIITQLPAEVPDTSKSSRYVAAIDYMMMLKYTGKERSGKEIEALCKKSGFSKFQVACSSYGIWTVFELYK